MKLILQFKIFYLTTFEFDFFKIKFEIENKKIFFLLNLNIVFIKFFMIHHVAYAGCIDQTTCSIKNYGVDIFFVILETFLEAFCFLIIPDFATFISSEFNLGKNFQALVLFLFSIKIFIFFKAFLYLLFRALFTIV